MQPDEEIADLREKLQRVLEERDRYREIAAANAPRSEVDVRVEYDERGAVVLRLGVPMEAVEMKPMRAKQLGTILCRAAQLAEKEQKKLAKRLKRMH